MDSGKNRIFCPLHSTEEIKRIDLEFGSEKELYCIECLLSVKDPVSLGGQLKPLDEFIEVAAKYYDSHRKRITNSIETPSEYLDVLSRQTENLEVVSKQIEDEKKRVQLKFDELTQDFLKIIKTKKDEYFHVLDKQLFNYRYAYIFFEKQLRKAYPKEDDISLFPTKDELVSKLSKLQNATQLLAFVKNLKEDLNESKISSGDMEWLTPEEARIILIKNISKKLDTIKNKTPTLIDPEADVTKAKEDFEKAFSGITDKLFNLSNEIEDVIHGEWPKSSLLKAADFAQIKKWLEKEFQNKKWKLIFKGTKDGQNATAFHKNCNNKGPTVTVIKSKAGKIFGGFLDKAWASTNNYVNTSRSFLFSITAKAKYEQNSGYNTYGAYDYSSYGPSFGGGHDIYLANDWTTNSNYCNRHSFNFPDNTTLTGGYNFTVEEVEVFSLDK
jgi:predicted  nucleic acid-binding Zn-ribbon protein